MDETLCTFTTLYLSILLKPFMVTYIPRLGYLFHRYTKVYVMLFNIPRIHIYTIYLSIFNLGM